MRVITARIPDDMFEKIKEIEESEKIDRAEATRKLLFMAQSKKSVIFYFIIHNTPHFHRVCK